MTNKITHAPQQVIDELNSIECYSPYSLLRSLSNAGNELLYSWVYRNTEQKEQKELAIINHVYANEKLQPERESRWYVEFRDASGEVFYIIDDVDTVVRLTYLAPDYDMGIDHETALKAKALYGGEIKEAK